MDVELDGGPKCRGFAGSSACLHLGNSFSTPATANPTHIPFPLFLILYISNYLPPLPSLPQENYVEPEVHDIVTLLESVLISSELGYSDPNTPLMVVEDVMDVVTIEGTERVFDFLEEKTERLTEVRIRSDMRDVC